MTLPCNHRGATQLSYARDVASLAIFWGFAAWGAAIVLYRVAHGQLRAGSGLGWPAGVLASLLIAAAASRFALEARLPATAPDLLGMTPGYKWWLLTAIAVFQLVTELATMRGIAGASAPKPLDASDTFRVRALAYASEGKYAAAIAQYRAILQRSPDDAEARAAIADLETKLPRPFLKDGKPKVTGRR